MRSVSKYHKEHPYVLTVRGETRVVNYEPAESQTGIFGGNSNWRGPVWFPINYLLIESLQQFHHYYGDDFKVECPTGSGQFMHLERSRERTFESPDQTLAARQEWRTPIRRAHSDGLAADRARSARSRSGRTRYLFHEYFHGDTGAGLGASHQTGWTGLVAKLIQQQGEFGTIKTQ